MFKEVHDGALVYQVSFSCFLSATMIAHLQGTNFGLDGSLKLLYQLPTPRSPTTFVPGFLLLDHIHHSLRIPPHAILTGTCQQDNITGQPVIYHNSLPSVIVETIFHYRHEYSPPFTQHARRYRPRDSVPGPQPEEAPHRHRRRRVRNTKAVPPTATQ